MHLVIGLHLRVCRQKHLRPVLSIHSFVCTMGAETWAQKGDGHCRTRVWGCAGPQEGVCAQSSGTAMERGKENKAGRGQSIWAESRESVDLNLFCLGEREGSSSCRIWAKYDLREGSPSHSELRKELPSQIHYGQAAGICQNSNYLAALIQP